MEWKHIKLVEYFVKNNGRDPEIIRIRIPIAFVADPNCCSYFHGLFKKQELYIIVVLLLLLRLLMIKIKYILLVLLQ